VHRFGSHFADPLPIRIGRQLAGRAHPFVTGNNRGHHTLAAVGFRDGRVVAGGAWAEKFSEAPLDVAAWVDFVCGLGFGRVVLVGHSYGGAKVVYYQAARQDPRVAGIVSASMPVRLHRRMQELPEAAALAERMVAEGRRDELLPYRMLGRGFTTRTAAAYLDYVRNRVDPFGAENADPPIAHVRCPVLALFGTQEPEVGTAADLELLRRNARAAARVDTRLIEGDHGYVGHEAAAADVLADWVATLG
jgi:pimeloyl-ACP methyl ester carboxylesterase